MILSPILRPILSPVASGILGEDDTAEYLLTIPDSYTPSSATTGQELLINESVIAKMSTTDQDTFWDNVANGGGDIRAYSDAGMTTRLPVDIMECDTSTRSLTMVTRRATYDGLGATYIKVGGGGSQPSVNAPYGRNEVWQDELNVYLGSTTDRAGNHDLVATGGVTQNDMSHTLPTFSLDGSTGYLEATGYYPVINTDPRSARGWLKTGVTDSKTIVTWGDDASGTAGARWELRLNSNKIRTEVNAGFELGTTVISNNAFRHYARTFNGTYVTDTIHYIDGALDGVDYSTNSGVNTGTSEPLRIGARVLGGVFEYFWDGNLSVILRANPVTAEFVATEYANQNDPAAFFGAPTITEI